MANNNSSLLIVVFPWLAFGHILPYLELSKSLARRGHRISFISTPRNIRRLPKIPPEISHLIDLVALNLPRVEGLPESAEATSDLPAESVEYLKLAFDGLETPFRNVIREATPKPDWIIHDFIQWWIPKIAADAGVPTIYLSIFMAGFMVFWGHPAEHSSQRSRPEEMAVPPPWIPFPSNLSFRLHEARTVVNVVCRPNVSGISDTERYRLVLQGCRAVAFRSCTEVEAAWLKLAPQILHKPVLPVGLLPRQEVVGDNADEDAWVVQWLDGQKPRSVVYIAFGSEGALQPAQSSELAHGLELAGLPFLWVLKRPEDLPEGFEERTKGHGVVARSWVPQLKILAHESVGGFLTHSGWSSVIESLQFGHPLVLLPIFSDQGINARIVMETGIAIEIERDEEDGNFTREAVAKALRLAIVEGESLRSRAMELKEVFSDKDRQEKYVDDFVRYLQDPESGAVLAQNL